MSSIFTYSKIHEAFFEEKGEELQYKKSYPLAWSNDNVPWVFFLKTGIVSATLCADDKSESLLGYFLPGMTFAQSGSFFDNRTVGISYEAVTPCTISRVSADVFWEKLESDPEFCTDYLRSTLKNNLLLIDRIAYQNEKGIRAKVVKWLFFMAKFYGDMKDDSCTIYIPLTQETIAEFLHCSRESVSITLAELTREGQIATRKKLITITNLSTLK